MRFVGRVMLGVGLVSLVGCGDDVTEEKAHGPASAELLDACEAYLTLVDGLAETNGCTRIDVAAACEQLHPDDRCEAERLAEYACMEQAVTAEDCQCEMEGGGVLCNEALATCQAEGDATLDCINAGG